jgi:hypothetical protein
VSRCRTGAPGGKNVAGGDAGELIGAVFRREGIRVPIPKSVPSASPKPRHAAGVSPHAAVVGKTGSGKTTLGCLVARRYDPAYAELAA